MKRSLLSEKWLDGSNELVKDHSNIKMKFANQPSKMLWHMRFAESFDPGGFAQVAGIGTSYGLLFAGILPMPFQIKSSVKIYNCNIHLFPVTPENVIPFDLCLEDFGEFIPAYHKIGENLSGEKREIKIGYVECKEGANDAGKDCLIVGGAAAVRINVRNLFRKINRGEVVPEYVLAVPRIGISKRRD